MGADIFFCDYELLTPDRDPVFWITPVPFCSEGDLRQPGCIFWQCSLESGKAAVALQRYVLCLSLECLPFVIQNGIHQRVPPASFEILILPQTALPLHAQLFQHQRGGSVFCKAAGPGAVHTQLFEAKAQDRACRFGSISMPPELRVQFVADICLACFGFPLTKGALANAGVTDQLPALRQDDDQLIVQPWFLQARIDHALDKCPDFTLVSQHVRVEALVALVTAVAMYCLPVIFHELSEQQAWGADLHHSCPVFRQVSSSLIYSGSL